MSIATHRIAESSTHNDAGPQLVWSRIDSPRSFASLPTASVAFRTWLATQVILGVLTALAAASAESFGISGGPVLVIGGFLLAVAALNFPGTARRRAQLRIVK
jgi:hypothetical protein